METGENGVLSGQSVTDPVARERSIESDYATGLSLEVTGRIVWAVERYIVDMYLDVLMMHGGIYAYMLRNKPNLKHAT